MNYIDNSSFATYYSMPQGQTDVLSPMSVVMAGDEQCAPTYRLQRNGADVSVLIYVIAGRGELLLGQSSITVAAGDLLTLPQGASYTYQVDPSDPWRIRWFNVVGELYPMLLKRYNLLDEPVYRNVGEPVVNGFASGMQTCQSDGSREQVQDHLCAVVYEVLLALWRQYCAPSRVAGLGQQLRNAIDDAILSDPGQLFSIGELAHLLGASVRQLERAFKKDCGMTPGDYFKQQKIVLAKQYLSNTPLTIKEISSKLGFCDQYYFSNCFKAQEGLSPKAYRSL